MYAPTIMPPVAQFYPTPHWATRLLLEKETFPGLTWEPAAGMGHTAHVLGQYGCDVVTSDLYPCDGMMLDHLAPLDFLTQTLPGQNRRIDHIVTNPPYKRAEEFWRRACDLAGSKVAMLMYASFLETQSRGKLFAEKNGKYRPSRIYIFENRLAMFPYGDRRHRDDEPAKGGGSRMFAWFVWDKAHRSLPQIDWVRFEKG